MGSDVGQIFPTASLYRDHSILYALVCEKELSHKGVGVITKEILISGVREKYTNKVDLAKII